MVKCEIPEITDEKLSKLMKKIKPMKRFVRVTASKVSRLEEDPEGDLYYLKPMHPREQTFAWDPKPTRLAKTLNPNPYKTIITHHTTGGFYFKPSMAEVLSQIPEEETKRAVAFITSHLRNETNETNHCIFHVAETVLYEKLAR